MFTRLAKSLHKTDFSYICLIPVIVLVCMVLDNCSSTPQLDVSDIKSYNTTTEQLTEYKKYYDDKYTQLINNGSIRISTANTFASDYAISMLDIKLKRVEDTDKTSLIFHILPVVLYWLIGVCTCFHILVCVIESIGYSQNQKRKQKQKYLDDLTKNMIRYQLIQPENKTDE